MNEIDPTVADVGICYSHIRKDLQDLKAMKFHLEFSLDRIHLNTIVEDLKVDRVGARLQVTLRYTQC